MYSEMAYQMNKLYREVEDIREYKDVREKISKVLFTLLDAGMIDEFDRERLSCKNYSLYEIYYNRAVEKSM